MDRQKVKSSAISEIGYDAPSETLEIKFKSSGGVYQYTGFAQKDWDWFRLAKSIGSHFAREIAGKYPAKRVQEPESAEKAAGTPQDDAKSE